MAQDLYTVGEAAAMLGVSAHTIRAWERRHGILQPARTASRHRRYSPEEIDLLRDIKRAVALEGLSVRLAFETVTGRQQRAAAEVAGSRSRPAVEDLLAGDQGMWRAVADALPELILIIDRDGKILQANVATAKAYGVVRQHLEGRAFIDLVDDFDRDKAEMLYKPQPRSVSGWELNLQTRAGSRLYRLQSRTLNQGGATTLALVASEMFTEADARRIAELHEQAIAMARDLPTANTVFQKLLNELPFGVAVTTIGPEPRVVYANQRLADTLANSLPNLTGRPLGELLPRALVEQPFHTAAARGAMQHLKGVAAIPQGDTLASQRVFDVVLQPLFSSAKKVASMLVVIEDASSASAEAHELATLLADHRFVRARTVRQLCEAAVEHFKLTSTDGEFVVALADPDDPGGPLVVLSSKDVAGEEEELIETLRDVIHRAGETGLPARDESFIRGRLFSLSCFPLGSRRKMGALAWRRPADSPLPNERFTAGKAVFDRLALGAELLHVRAEAARRASKLQAIVEIAAVVRESGDQAGLGVRFLKRLTEIIEADGAAIGRIDAADFVVEAAYAPFGAHAKPGDRFPLQGQFVSQSIVAGEPTEATQLGTASLPPVVKRTLARMRSGISVPLVVDGKVDHVITLVRSGDRPFDESDVMIAQAVSSVALLALNVDGGLDAGSAGPPESGRRPRSRRL